MDKKKAHKSSPDADSVASLIVMAKGGDQAAFEALLDRYAPLLDSMTAQFAIDTPIGQDREDLHQEALVAFFAAVMSFRTEQEQVKFGLYAKECIRNRLISHLRRQQKHAHVLFMEDSGEPLSQAESSDDPVRALAEEEAYTMLSRQIRELLSPYENRVWWAYLSGRTASEIAAALQTDEKSVTNAIYRIRRKLRAEIPYTP